MVLCAWFRFMNHLVVTTPILLLPLVWEPFHGTMYHESILTLTLPLVPFSKPFCLTGGESSLYTPAMFIILDWGDLLCVMCSGCCHKVGLISYIRIDLTKKRLDVMLHLSLTQGNQVIHVST